MRPVCQPEHSTESPPLLAVSGRCCALFERGTSPRPHPSTPGRHFGEAHLFARYFAKPLSVLGCRISTRTALEIHLCKLVKCKAPMELSYTRSFDSGSVSEQFRDPGAIEGCNRKLSGIESKKFPMNSYQLACGVVVNEARVPEPFHKIGNARPCSPHHLRQRFLTNLRNIDLG